jgi:hypothetical protein
MKSICDYYNIEVLKQERCHEGFLHVSRRSPRLWKQVGQFAQYMQRELHYDFPLFDLDGPADGVAAYLAGYGRAWVGACAFRETSGAGSGTAALWLLEWIWLHPYVRRRGLLTRAWPSLSQTHGDFLLLDPLSDTMRKFAKAQHIDEESVIIR